MRRLYCVQHGSSAPAQQQSGSLHPASFMPVRHVRALPLRSPPLTGDSSKHSKQHAMPAAATALRGDDPFAQKFTISPCEIALLRKKVSF